MDQSNPNTSQRGGIYYGLAMLVTLIGLVDAIYLTVQHLTGRGVRCTVVAGCSAVLSSRYAVIGGMPLAALGAVAYFTAFSCATLALFGSVRSRMGLRMMAAAMLGMTLWLLYVQAFVLRAFCSYCLLSALMTFLLAVLVLLARLSEAKQTTITARRAAD